LKNIGVLTSGGDSPGMNAAIRAVVRYGIYHGMNVFGIEEGYKGLMEGKVSKMEVSSVANIIHRGGTILRSARSDEFMTEGGQKKALNILKSSGIEGLIVIGGDGSFRGAKDLSDKGINVIGVPGTIDNDLGYTDYTIGFDTVVNTVVDAIGKIRDTTESHGRASIIEVMGRNCGDIALFAGIAGGADSIIVPEKGLEEKTICKKLVESRKRGKRHSIIIFSEGVGDMTPYELGDMIKRNTDIDTRVTILGHLQRGGSPTAFDRLLASKFGAEAVKLLMEGKDNRIVGRRNGKIINEDIIEGLAIEKEFDEETYKLTEILSI
jgi:6-phosphofructokinase 1